MDATKQPNWVKVVNEMIEKSRCLARGRLR